MTRIWGGSGEGAHRALSNSLILERTGVEQVDDAARTSTPWTFVVMFLGASVAPANIVYGWIPITFGLGVWGGVSSIVAGTLVGILLLVPLIVIGSVTATNNATASGAHFGVRGRLIGSFIGLATMVTLTAVSVWTGGGVVVGVLHRLVGVEITDGVRVLAYFGLTAIAALIAIYGYHVLLRAMKLVTFVGGLLMVLMLVGFADRIDLGYAGGSYILGDFWRTWLLSVAVVGVGSVLFVGTMLGDWMRYISPRRYPARQLVPVAALGIFIGFVVPLGLGTFLTSAFADPFASFPESLATSGPGWFAVVLLPLACVSGLGFTSAALYSGGLDLDSIARRLTRTTATITICVVAVVLVLVGTLAQDASDSIATASHVLLVLITPWVAIVDIGYLRCRGSYRLEDLQVFNRGQSGGAYWFSGGVHRGALLAWTVGATFGFLALHTNGYVGPFADLAGGVDVSFLGSFLVAGLVYLATERAAPALRTRSVW